MTWFRTLSATDMADPHFFQLLRDAAGQPDAHLRTLIRERLPTMTVLGLVDDDLHAFAAYWAAATGVELEYIAVAADRRSKGYGTRMMLHIQSVHDGAEIVAETDDDAVGFYRRLGFQISQRDRDPRWPTIQRYRCILASTRSQ